MRNPDPQPEGDQYEGFRYAGAHDNRYDEFLGRDVPVAPYDYRGSTLEEEAYNGGWLQNARPTGPAPEDLMTIGMRGEPDWDDDPQPAPDGCGFVHPDPK
jgi:hypothetical protein